VGGTFLAIGVYYTAKTLQVNRESQITRRFTSAVEQLGIEKIEVRVGAVFALERISRDSPDDHMVIVEILATFVREHAGIAKGHVGEPVRTAADVQAALTVIG